MPCFYILLVMRRRPRKSLIEYNNADNLFYDKYRLRPVSHSCRVSNKVSACRIVCDAAAVAIRAIGSGLRVAYATSLRFALPGVTAFWAVLPDIDTSRETCECRFDRSRGTLPLIVRLPASRRSAPAFGTRVLCGGIACIVQGIMPFLFVRTGSRTIAILYAQVVNDRDRRTATHDDPACPAAAVTRSLRILS